MIAIDSSVLIDLLGDGERAEAAEVSLRQALARGPVVVCDVVVSEVVSGLAKFGSGGGALLSALEEAGIAYNAVALGCCTEDAPYWVAQHMVCDGQYWIALLIMVILALFPR